ncbi:MAG: hypothetical protein IJ126_05135, partial [Lachnospiraceae bacterium]|nr:hypothetical protein [Lachnospiraceae bacterium]
MRKNFADLVKIGVVIPTLIVSMAACGAASAQGTPADDKAETTEAVEAVENTESGEPAAESTQATAEPKLYENRGYKLSVPGELADKITVEAPDLNDDGVIFSAYETKSVDAAKAKGNDNLGYGWLFTITERNEEEAHKMMIDAIGDQQPIAVTADGVYLIFNHPTDVRYERATVEDMEKDQAEWTAACEWASSVIKTFATDNGLTQINFYNTAIESALAKAAYEKDANYTISTLEHGPLAPNGVDPLPFYEKMTKDAVFENIDLAESDVPDGEYVVLTFPDDQVRYDFFFAEGSENIIRQVVGPEGGEQYS